MKIVGATLSLLIFSSLQANPFEKAKKWYDKKVEPEVKKVEQKVGSWIESRKEANPQEMEWLREKSAEVKKLSQEVASDIKVESAELWDKVEESTQQTYKKVETYTSETWDDWTLEKKAEAAKVEAPASELSKSAKLISAKKTYAIVVNRWSQWIGASTSSSKLKKDDELIVELETILKDNNLAVAELVYVTNDKGENLLHYLVREVAKRESSYRKSKEENKKVVELENDPTFQHMLFLVSVLCKSVPLASQKDSSGVTPVGYLLAQKNVNWNLVEFVATHDGSEAVLLEVKPALEKASVQ